MLKNTPEQPEEPVILSFPDPVLALHRPRPETEPIAYWSKPIGERTMEDMEAEHKRILQFFKSGRYDEQHAAAMLWAVVNSERLKAVERLAGVIMEQRGQG